MSVKDDYIQWKLKNEAVGCLFARMIAGRPRDYGHETYVVQASKSPAIMAAAACRVIDRLATKRAGSATAVLFPNINTIEVLGRTFLAFRSKPSWSISTAVLEHPYYGKLVTVAMTRQIANANGVMLPPEALVLGPFEEFPATRRAPVVALEMFVGEPMALDPKDGKTPAQKINLAHIRTPDLQRKAYENMIAKTGITRRRSLGLSLKEGAEDEDHRAKAKVSFVLPIGVASALGVQP